jgi:hypothetical protein
MIALGGMVDRGVFISKKFHICMDPTMLRRIPAVVPLDIAAESC